MSGGSKSITREEMRAFKKVWAECANAKTGYLERSSFAKFFGVSIIMHLLYTYLIAHQKLGGIFEVSIYSSEYKIPKILARCAENQGSTNMWTSTVDGVSIDKLNATLSGIDRAATKRRKNLYNRLFHEARISHEPGKGISFTNMLLLLAHHKLIVDRDALV